MEKAYSEIVGMPVIVEGAGKVTRVTDVLTDPDDGKVCAFFTGKMKAVTPMDIIFFGKAITIGSFEDIIDADDLVKVTNILKNENRILQSRVETKKGDYLGKLYDYFIDVKAFGLTKIVVHKSFLGLFKSPDRLISARDIIEIKKDLVIVKNKHAKKPVPAENEEKVKELYPDMA
jgi:uncharacterized protein YrrD